MPGYISWSNLPPAMGLPDFTPEQATVLAALVVAAVSVLGLGVNIWLTGRVSKSTLAQQVGMAGLDYRIRQLNEFYGPLVLRMRENHLLANKLREHLPDGNAKEEWRLLDHLPDILEDPDRGPLARTIIENDRHISELILTKGGLSEGVELPQEFEEFLHHYKVLSMAVDSAPPTKQQIDYFPRGISDVIKRDFATVKAAVHGYVARAEDHLGGA